MGSFIILALVFAGLAFYIMKQPEEFRITRSAVMKAPPPVIFAEINDFRQWAHWSPWAKLDLTARNRFEGPTSGEGAMFTWAGNNKVGEGTMTIVESKPYELIRITLAFLKPFKATNTAEYTFTPQTDNATLVTWSMYGKNTFIGKAVNLVMNCEKMVGKQFEEGLANMKAVAEAKA